MLEVSRQKPGPKQKRRDHPAPAPFPLRVKNLCYETRDKRLIDYASFTIEQAGVSAIMGPNGAGKSLTLRLLHGLIAPTSGEISWGGYESVRRAASCQSMVFQKPVLLRRSVEANLAYALKIRGLPENLAEGTPPERLIAETLAHAGLDHRAKSPARALSGGEQQRLALARALMHRPAILLLDEPTSSLDPNAISAVETLISEAANSGTKIILVTHDSGQARRLSDEILFFNQGKMIEQGQTDDILNAPQTKAAGQYFNGEIVTDS